MTRLTVSIKEEIRKNIHKELFKPRLDKVISERRELTDYVYFNILYSEKELEWINSAPSGALTSIDSLSLTITKRNFTMAMSKSRPVFAKDCHGWIYLDKYPDVAEKYESLDRIKEEINDDKRTLMSDASAILNSVNTVKKLLEVWPDSKKYFSVERTKPLNLPAINTESLDKLICRLKEKGK